MAGASPVRPRAITDVLSEPITDRHGILAEGLELLVEHVQELQASIESLGQSGHRGRPILEAVMGEEAAKVLIVLDVVRGGWRDQIEARRRLGYFNDHFARGVYQRVTAINPGTFGEVREYVELLRPELYLDGPNDADWIFRNEIESSRELALYVDYVQEEEHRSWVTPRHQASSLIHWPANLTADLVCAMARIGLLTEEGLGIVAANWKDAAFVDNTTFNELSALTSAVLKELIDRRLYAPTAAQGDFQHVAEHWPFPLNSLELKKVKVTHEELEAERSRIEDAFWYNELGPIEY